MATIWNPSVSQHNTVEIDDIEISFACTFRLPESHDVSELALDFYNFPLFHASDYAATLPETMASKGGLFFAMYRMFLHHIIYLHS
jgi:hypothetical protein